MNFVCFDFSSSEKNLFKKWKTANAYNYSSSELSSDSSESSDSSDSPPT